MDTKGTLLRNLASEMLQHANLNEPCFVEDVVLLARLTLSNGQRTAAVMSTMEHDLRALLGLLRGEILRVERLLTDAAMQLYGQGDSDGGPEN